MSSEFGFCWLLYVDGCQDKMYTLVGSMFFSTRLTLMGPLFCIYLVPCSVNLWVPCCGIVMSRKGGENKRTSLDVVALLCLSFC